MIGFVLAAVAVILCHELAKVYWYAGPPEVSFGGLVSFFRSVFSLCIYALLLSIVYWVFYVLMVKIASLFARARFPTTRISAAAAGLTFSALALFVLHVIRYYGYEGVPGFITIPLASLASVAVERLVARSSDQRSFESC